MMRSRSHNPQPSGSPVTFDGERSRGRILDLFLGGLSLITLAVLAVFVGLTLLGRSHLLGAADEVRLAYVAMLVMLVGLAILLLVRRFVSTTLASVLLLALWILASLVCDTPEQVTNGRGLVAFMAPIALSAVLLPPWAIFATTISISIVLSGFAWVTQGSYLTNMFAHIIYYVTATGLWLAMRTVQRSAAVMRTSEARYRATFEQASVGMAEMALDGRYLRVNQRLCDIMGYSQAELLERTGLDITHPEDRERTTQASPAIYQAGAGGVALEKRYIHKDGHIVWAEVRATPCRDASGVVEHFILVYVDVTDRHAAQARADSLARFPSEDPSPVMRLSSSGEVLYANAASTPLLRTWETREGQCLPQAWRQHIEAALALGGSVAHQVECGDRIYMLNLVPVVEAAYVNLYGHDVTEQRHLEEHLRQTSKMEAVGRLAGGVAHDFNNLLTVINGYAEFLMSELDQASPHYADVAEIAAAGERAARLTRQLLAFSRRQLRQPQHVDLNDTVSGMNAMLRRLLGEDVRLVLDLEPALDAVQADPSQIEQVIMNLAVNARDAMPDGGVLTLQTANIVWEAEHAKQHMDTVPGEYVMLIVSDTGVGMSADVQEHLFEPFFTTKGLGQGTGLGLAAVYGIVRQNGGFIYAYSEPGLGTTFKVFLPRHMDPTGEPAPESAPEARLPGGNESILVVEDDEHVRGIAVRALSELGYRVTSVSDPTEALALFSGGELVCDLIVSDLIMPGMTGTELIAALADRGIQVPVLYMSGYPLSSLGNHSVLSADTHLLQKPFDRAQIAARVRGLLDEV